MCLEKGNVLSILFRPAIVQGGIYMDRKTDLKKAHEAEMREAANGEPLYVLTAGQIRAVQTKYASLCAEYLACNGIYSGFHDAGFDEKASPFAVAATIAAENARAVGEILDILQIKHPEVP